MVSGTDGSLTHQSYVNKLNLVDTFDKILTKKEVKYPEIQLKF
jgi:hypothetical protein